MCKNIISFKLGNRCIIDKSGHTSLFSGKVPKVVPFLIEHRRKIRYCTLRDPYLTPFATSGKSCTITGEVVRESNGDFHSGNQKNRKRTTENWEKKETDAFQNQTSEGLIFLSKKPQAEKAYFASKIAPHSQCSRCHL